MDDGELDGEATRVVLPEVHHADGFTRYQNLVGDDDEESMAHEAG